MQNIVDQGFFIGEKLLNPLIYLLFTDKITKKYNKIELLS